MVVLTQLPVSRIRRSAPSMRRPVDESTRAIDGDSYTRIKAPALSEMMCAAAGIEKNGNDPSSRR